VITNQSHEHISHVNIAVILGYTSGELARGHAERGIPRTVAQASQKFLEEDCMTRFLTAIALAAITLLALGIAIVVAVSIVRGNLNALAFGTVLALLVVGGVLWAVSWISGLVTAAGLRRWDWFVAVLLLGAPASLALSLSHQPQPATASR
jgi:hypothetical protein